MLTEKKKRILNQQDHRNPLTGTIRRPPNTLIEGIEADLGKGNTRDEERNVSTRLKIT